MFDGVCKSLNALIFFSFCHILLAHYLLKQVHHDQYLNQLKL